MLTLPDNPTGRVARPATVRALCQVAAAHRLIIICDEIYRDLVHDPATPVLSPALVAPQRTVVTTGLSKSLALGGWRIGAARLPDGALGKRLRRALLGAASEIWSAPAMPIQHAAALAFAEPAEITERIAASRSLHATVARAVADVCATAGLLVLPPQAAFYSYPDFVPWRDHLRRRHGVSPPRAAWPGCCWTAMASPPCPPAPSANPLARCGCGWPPGCSVVTTTSSARPHSPTLTPSRCPGSPPHWPGCIRYSPT